MKLIGDVFQKSWTYEQRQDIGKQVYVGFRDNGEIAVTFDNLRFGIAVFLDGEQLMEASLPDADNEYLFSDQDFLAWFDVHAIRLGVEYQLTVWAENAGDRWEDTFTVLLPRHPQPYPSWSWHDEFECWVPPVPYPEINGPYEWDEDAQEWRAVTV